MTTTKKTPIRVYTHFKRIVLEGADGYLSKEQAEALSRVLQARASTYDSAPELVFPNGTVMWESDFK